MLFVGVEYGGLMSLFGVGGGCLSIRGVVVVWMMKIAN